MWRVYRDAGRPWPVICDDDVIDYMVMEAVAIKVRREDEQLQKEAEEARERNKFKKDRSSLDKFR